MSFRLFVQRTSFVFASLAVPLLLAHCKSDTTEVSSAGSGLTRDAFIAQYCELASPCCTSAGLGNGQCPRSFGAAVPTSFDSTSGQACLDAVRAQTADAHFCSSTLGSVTACKLLAPRGSVAVGASCNDAVTGVECAASAEGHVACVFGGGVQVCQVQTLGTEGSACVGDSSNDGTLAPGVSIDVTATGQGVYCNRATGLHCVSQTCVKRIALGGACTSTADCAADGYCSFDTKVCTALVADGSACTNDESCASRRCDTSSKRCTSKGSAFSLAATCGGT